MPEIRVGSILLHRCKDFGICRFWEVEALAVGGLKQESLVRLRSLSETPGVDEDGRKHETTVVPEALLRDLELYQPTRRNVEASGEGSVTRRINGVRRRINIDEVV